MRIVRAETPQIKGINGAANCRNVGYFLEAGSLEYVKVMDKAVVALMIEKEEAIDNLEEILSVEEIAHDLGIAHSNLKEMACPI